MDSMDMDNDKMKLAIEENIEFTYASRYYIEDINSKINELKAKQIEVTKITGAPIEEMFHILKQMCDVRSRIIGRIIRSIELVTMQIKVTQALGCEFNQYEIDSLEDKILDLNSFVEIEKLTT